MFFHNFKYMQKTLFKNKVLIFWTFLFPIILGLFFNMAFSNIENSEQLNVFDIGIVETKEFQNNFFYQETFKALSKDNDNKLFNIKYVNLKEAKNLLKNKEIIGYIEFLDHPVIVFDESGIHETILKTVVDEMLEQEFIINDIMSTEITSAISDNPIILNNIEELKKDTYNQVLNLITASNVNIKDISRENMSYTMIEYYTLIAMTCLYGGILGMWVVNKCLANMGSVGKRITIAPTKKSVMVLSSAIAGYIAQLIGLSLLFLFTIFIIKVDYGNHLLPIIIIAMVGALTGLSLGIMLASTLKCNEDLKIGIMISLTMLGCFLSGMMGITMKYIVDKNIPIFNAINPANLITDGFYALYYYDTLNRFLINVFSLIAISFIFIIVSIYSLRRSSYDHI